MKHQPDVFGFVQADFDEMIASAQRAEMIDVISTIQRWMFLKNEVVRRLQGLPRFCISRRDVVPGSSIAFAAVIGTSMRYRSLDCFNGSCATFSNCVCASGSLVTPRVLARIGTPCSQLITL